MFDWIKKKRHGATSQQAPDDRNNQVRQQVADGFALLQSGNNAAANEMFVRVLQVQPDHADALYLTGVIAASENRHEDAITMMERAIASDSKIASFHHTLANLLVTQGRATEAVKYFAQAVQLDPDSAQAQSDFGIALQKTGRTEESLEHFRSALRLAPPSVDAYYNLGTALQSLARHEDAIECYMSALSLDPSHAESSNNLGVSLQAAGRLEEAIACFQRLLARHPQHAMGWNNLGCALQSNRLPADARTCLEHAVALAPHDFNAHSNLALTLRELGELEASMQSSRHALAIRDSSSEHIRLATLLPVIADSAADIKAWRTHFDHEIDALMAQHITLDNPLRDVGACNFNLAYQPECNRDLQKKTAKLYADACPTLLYTARHTTAGLPRRPGKMRIGFISRFMHNHSIGRTTRGLLATLEREEFHVTALFVPPFVDDSISRFICDSADEFVRLPTTLESARTTIAALELDILFYQDIGMDAFTYYLAYSRLATVQCVSFGHPDTTGIPNMDYWVSSEHFEREDASADYSEKLFLLRNVGTLAYYYRPELSQPYRDRAHFNLPAERHLYLCAQALFKVHPDFDAILAGILEADENAEILFVDARVPTWGERLRKRLRNSMPELVHRVRFIPPVSQEDFLALIAVCDVMLDTIYFNGMNTSLEAFSMGIPIVTMPSKLQRGRHTYGMYRHLQLDDCIAHSAQEYVDIAVRLGTAPAFHAEIKQAMLSRCHLLFEDKNIVREFERFFRFALEEKSVTRVPDQPAN